MLNRLINVLDDAPSITTADIVIIVVIVLIVLALVGYFAYKQINGKRINDCGCGSTDAKKLVKSYFKKYPKEKKDENKTHHNDGCCCGNH